MILCDDTLFVHVPKVGGMSVTAWMLNNLSGRIVMSLPESAQTHALRSLEFDDIEGRLSFIRGGRHATIKRSLKLCEVWKVGRPKRVVTLVRPAYDLVRSYYQYLQRPKVAARMQIYKIMAAEAKLASSVSFAQFASSCTIMGRNQNEMMRYYEMADPNIILDIVPLEHSQNYLNGVFAHHASCGRFSLPKRNSAKNKIDHDMAAEQIIKERFPMLQMVYEEALADWPGLAKEL